MLIGIGVILLLCCCMSTRTGRAEWTERLRPMTRRFGWAAAVLWAAIIAGWIWPPVH